MLDPSCTGIQPTNFKEIIMTLFIQKPGLILIVTLLSFSFSSVAYGAGCKIKYGWNKGNTLQGTFKNKTKTITLSKGQTKTINKKRMNYVKNLKSRNVKFYLKNAQNVTLGKDQRNPIAGTYVGTVKLKKVKCLGDSSSSSSSGGTVLPGSTVHGSECAGFDVAKVPAPPAPFIPTPFPNINPNNRKNCKP
jgi:hypothetical protein